MQNVHSIQMIPSNASGRSGQSLNTGYHFMQSNGTGGLATFQSLVASQLNMISHGGSQPRSPEIQSLVVLRTHIGHADLSEVREVCTFKCNKALHNLFMMEQKARVSHFIYLRIIKRHTMLRLQGQGISFSDTLLIS